MTREHEPATENLCRQEAQEYLNAIQDALLDLFEDADSASIDRRLDGLLSSVRSLRGEAEEAQWWGIAKLSQRLEENLQRIRLYRPQLGLKFQNLWRQTIAALRAAIAVQGESPFADRIGVEATAAEVLDRLELHFTEAPAGEDPWAELEHCLRLLESLRGGWQEVAEAQADLVAVQESLAELGLAIPEVAAIGQWLEEAAASCQDLTQWQELGEQTAQRLQEALGTGDSNAPHRLDFPGEGPFEFPDVNDTELFAQEDNTGTADPFAWFEPTAETPTNFLQEALAGGDGETLASFLGSLSEFGGEEETEHGSDLYPTQELNLWGEDQSPDQEAPEFGVGGDDPLQEEGVAIAEGLGDWNLWEEPTAVPELGSEPDFPVATTEGPAAAGLEDLGLWEEPTAVLELGSEPDFTAATTEGPVAAGLEDFWEEPTAVPELGSEPDFTAATTEEPAAPGLGDLTFWREAGYDAGLAADIETMAEALAGLDSWREPVSPPPDSSEEISAVGEAEGVGDENPEISLDGLLTDLDATLPDMNELSAILSDGDLTDLEQTLAMSEFEALNFDLSDDIGDETPSLPVPGFSDQLSDLAATFDGEPPALPKVRPVSRPVFSGIESVVFTAMEPVSTDFPGDQWSTQTLYDVAADLGAGQIVLNWQLQQLRTAVRSLLSSTRNLGTPTEATPETAFPDGILPEGLLRLREISEDIDLALFEIEQTNADRQRQIWQVQELARDERLCTLGSLGQQLAQGLTSVQLIVENSTVALDRTFMNKLAEPLGNLLKLLTDRSLEEPAERQRLGKPVVGTLRIRGVAVGDTLNLEITDDGAGLPFDIFQPEAPGAPIAHRCQGLGIALRPDFTTGRGSRINLQLPYVLLMTRVLIVRIGPAMVAVRAEHVRDILAAPPGDSRTVIWGHRTIPWINPQDRFQVNCRRQELPVFEKPDQENVLVVLQSGDHQYALAVDACWREQEATLQRLAGGMALSFPFCGCAVLTDGRVIPLFAPAEMLFQPNEDNTQLRLLEKQKRQSAREILTRRSPQLILLVDDSINVRRYLASVLESAGFATVQARDGLEALEKLDNGLQPGAIISDLEMPRMDGYTLLRRVRSREIYRNIPFVVLTSRTNERHRQQAEELGATAYVNKPYRNEEIVSLVRRLTATER